MSKNAGESQTTNVERERIMNLLPPFRGLAEPALALLGLHSELLVSGTLGSRQQRSEP